ncbi:hypothetical protein B0A48_08161 [Cryoendolithus antarcticus]|uniref:Mediator of RNA polymerase II transcription subunit 16 n=1 Tax=Cryoendolithus antarcticus TaxID=1507870 RepID=A0A1V8T1K4_9PEZI|nr:hypothetical protein B0A48_08161 [Cryoendolithus antarcticus]
MDNNDLADAVMADIQIPSASMMDSMDDLFGEPTNLVVQAPLLLGPPAPAELVLRIAEMQRHGCCTAQCVSDASSNPIIALPGSEFVHLQYTSLGQELAVVDSVGNVQIFTGTTGLGRMSFAPTTGDSEAEGGRSGLDAVVGMYWLPQWPMDFRIPYVGPAVKTDGTWSSKLHYRDQQAPRLHHPVDGKTAFLYVTRNTLLTLCYQHDATTWGTASTTLEPLSTLDETLSHAAFCQQDNKLLLVTHDLRRHMRVYTITIDWNGTQGKDQYRSGTLRIAPSLLIGHSVSLEYVAPQHSEGTLLTSLQIILPVPIFAESSVPSYTTIVATFAQASYPSDATQQAQSFTTICRWHLEQVTQNLHPSFAKLQKRAAAAVTLPNKNTLRRQPDLVTAKVILTIQPMNHDTLIAFGASDGTVECRDRETWNIVAPTFGDTTTVTSLPQAGFEFTPSLEHSVHIMCNTDCAYMITLGVDQKLRCKPAALRYGWQAIDDGILDISGMHETAIACVAREHTLLTHHSNASALELFALLPPDLAPEQYRHLLFDITRALTRAHDLGSLDEKTKQRMLLGDNYIIRCLGAQLSLVSAPVAQPGIGAQLAWVVLTAKQAHFALFSSCSTTSPPDPATLHSLRGLAIWSLELFTASLATLFTVHSIFVAKPNETPATALASHIASSSSPLLHLVLCSYPRTLLRYLALALTRYFKLVASSLVNSPSLLIKTDLLETISKIKTLPFRLEILAAPDGLLGEIDRVVGEAYAVSTIGPRERAEAELTMLFSPAPDLPTSLNGAVKSIWTRILPKYTGEMDLGALYFYDTAGLILQSRERTGARAKRSVDVLTKLPIAEVFSLLALSALAASVSAQQSSPDLVSIISVLQTGLPSSILQEALTNSAGLSSEIASEFRVATPTWFTALPTDIQTYLVSAANSPSAFANATAGIASTLNGTAVMNSTSVAAAQSSILSSNSAEISSEVASASAAGTTSRGAGSGAASATSAGASSSSSAAGASMPTALYGMGLAGAVGLVGVLAL